MKIVKEYSKIKESDMDPPQEIKFEQMKGTLNKEIIWTPQTSINEPSHA
jgi:hypothetical protein